MKRNRGKKDRKEKGKKPQSLAHLQSMWCSLHHLVRYHLKFPFFITGTALASGGERAKSWQEPHWASEKQVSSFPEKNLFTKGAAAAEAQEGSWLLPTQLRAVLPVPPLSWPAASAAGTPERGTRPSSGAAESAVLLGWRHLFVAAVIQVCEAVADLFRSAV